MAVFRIERTRDYTVMSNHHLRNANLSLKAKGLLSMMLSLPEDWNYTTRGLAKICKEGVDAIGAALRELEGAGYIVRHQRRDKSGRITDTEYVIYEQPQPDMSQPDTASPDTENPDMVKPDTEKPAELNIEKSNTQKSITDGSITDSLPFRETAAARPPERKGRDEDNTESMVFDPQEIMEHGGLCGVDREEWEKSPQFHERVMERQEHQQEREQAFLYQNRDCFAIYQVTRDDPQNVRFMNLDWLKSHDISIDRSNYDLIYTAPLSESGTVLEQLEKLYQQFNLEKPVDYHSPSMSVSDIVAIKQDGKVSCHYCDSVGFTQISSFLPENPLKNAEMAVEDDYGMIDGIINNGTKEPTVAELEQQARSGQPISLMDLAAATHREEREKKKSVVDQLKSQPKAEHKKIAPKKSAEREI